MDVKACLSSCLHGAFLLLLFVGDASLKSSCPYDVSTSTSNCLSPVRLQLSNVNQAFYSGVDVETIRSICASLRRSVICAQELRNSCPATETHDIELVLQGVISVAELCQRIPSPHNLLEVYARHQNCFTRLGATSETCYQTFRIEGEPLQRRLATQPHSQPTLKQYCKEFGQLVDCVRVPVRVTCGDEAGQLVELLLRPSVRFSELCREDPVEDEDHTEVKKPSPTASQENHPNHASPASRHSSLVLTLCSLLTALNLC